MDLDVIETIGPIFQSKLKKDTSHASPETLSQQNNWR